MACYSRRDEAEDSLELARDVALVQLREAGRPWRWISGFLGTPEATLRYRYASIDPAARAIYAATPLDFLRAR